MFRNLEAKSSWSDEVLYCKGRVGSRGVADNREVETRCNVIHHGLEE